MGLEYEATPRGQTGSSAPQISPQFSSLGASTAMPEVHEDPLQSADSLDAAFNGDNSAMEQYLSDSGGFSGLESQEASALDASSGEEDAPGAEAGTGLDPSLEAAYGILGLMQEAVAALPPADTLGVEVDAAWLSALQRLDSSALADAGALILARFADIQLQERDWDALCAALEENSALSLPDPAQAYGMQVARQAGAELVLQWECQVTELTQAFRHVGLSMYAGAQVGSATPILFSQDGLADTIRQSIQGVESVNSFLEYLRAGSLDRETAMALLDPCRTNYHLFDFMRAVLQTFTVSTGGTAWDLFDQWMTNEDGTQTWEEGLEGTRQTEANGLREGLDARRLELAGLNEQVGEEREALDDLRLPPTLADGDLQAVQACASELLGSVQEASAMQGALRAAGLSAAEAVSTADPDALLAVIGETSEESARLEALLSEAVNADLGARASFPPWEDLTLHDAFAPAHQALEEIVVAWAAQRAQLVNCFDLPVNAGSGAEVLGPLGPWLQGHVAEEVAPTLLAGRRVRELAASLPAEPRGGAEEAELRALFDAHHGRPWMYLYSQLVAAGAPGWMRSALDENRPDNMLIEEGIASGIAERDMLSMTGSVAYVEDMFRANDATLEARDDRIGGAFDHSASLGVAVFVAETFNRLGDSIDDFNGLPGDETFSNETLARTAVEALERRSGPEREMYIRLLVQHNLWDRINTAAEGTIWSEHLADILAENRLTAAMDPDRVYEGGILEAVDYSERSSVVGVGGAGYGLASSLPLVGSALEGLGVGEDYRRVMLGLGEALGLNPEDAAAALQGGELVGGVLGAVGMAGMSMGNPGALLKLANLGLNVTGAAQGVYTGFAGQTPDGRQVGTVDQVMSLIGGLAGTFQAAGMAAGSFRSAVDATAVLSPLGGGLIQAATNPDHSGNAEDWVSDYGQPLLLPLVNMVSSGWRPWAPRGTGTQGGPVGIPAGPGGTSPGPESSFPTIRVGEETWSVIHREGDLVRVARPGPVVNGEAQMIFDTVDVSQLPGVDPALIPGSPSTEAATDRVRETLELPAVGEQGDPPAPIQDVSVRPGAAQAEGSTPAGREIQILSPAELRARVNEDAASLVQAGVLTSVDQARIYSAPTPEMARVLLEQLLTNHHDLANATPGSDYVARARELEATGAVPPGTADQVAAAPDDWRRQVLLDGAVSLEERLEHFATADEAWAAFDAHVTAEPGREWNFVEFRDGSGFGVVRGEGRMVPGDAVRFRSREHNHPPDQGGQYSGVAAMPSLRGGDLRVGFEESAISGQPYTQRIRLSTEPGPTYVIVTADAATNYATFRLPTPAGDAIDGIFMNGHWLVTRGSYSANVQSDLDVMLLVNALYNDGPPP